MKPRLYHSTARHLKGVIEPNENSPVDGKPGKFVFAQPDDVTAYAYAIKNDEVFTTGHGQWIFTAARRRQEFLDQLPKDEQGRPGGYVYEVAPNDFEEAMPGHPRQEWISTQPAPIISGRFVTLQEVMEKGVQVFVVDDPSYFREKNISHPDGQQLLERYKAGEVGWLNQEYGINPIMPPPAVKTKKPPDKKPKPR